MGSDHNMDHMLHIQDVALSDLTVLREKEATYQGSWKRSGGRSAWFMVRRMMDRLLVMLAPPVAPHDWSGEDLADLLSDTKDGDDVTLDHSILNYLWQAYKAENIFAMIRQGPGGEDGTVLAVLRDLRRYLILVEAEMVSRGVVTPVLQESGLVYDEKGISELDGIARSAVRQLLSENYVHGRVYVYDEVQMAFREYQFPTGVMDRGVCSATGQPISAEHEKRKEAREALERVPTPLTPWVVGDDWLVVSLSRDDGDLYYNRRAPDVFVLEAMVDRTTVARDIPRALAPLYGLLADNVWVLDIASCPAEARDYFPWLAHEVNAKVYDELPRWQRNFYTWVEDETKFRLHLDFRAWSRL